MRCNPDTVDVLYKALSSPQPASWDASDPRTWRCADRALSPAQVALVQRATHADFDALDVLLAVDRHLLTLRRDAAHDRLRSLGLPCDLPPLR